MAAIPIASTLIISNPPLSAAPSPRGSFLRRVPPSDLGPTRCSSVPSSVEIISSTECSDGSVIFRFADAEDLKRGKELRESRDGEFGERMEGAVESSKLAGESEVLDRELGVESRDSDVEMGASESDAVSEKKMGLVGSKMCLESENLDGIEVLGRSDALTEKGTGLEAELERDRGTGLKVESEIGLLERDQGSLLEVEPEPDSLERDQETETDLIGVCEEQVKNSQVYVEEEEKVEESMGCDHKEHLTSVETVDRIPENGEASIELESQEYAESGQEIEGKGIPLDEISEEEKSSAVGVEQKGESSDDLLLTEEVSTLVEGDNFRVPVSEVSLEQLDDALVSTERLEDDSEASEVSLTAVADLDMDAESSSTPVQENAEEKDTAETSDMVVSITSF